MIVDDLMLRLATYPGAHENETWKLEKDLSKCSDKEKERMAFYGLTYKDFEAAGLNRGEVAHILYGYKHTEKRRNAGRG